MTPRRFIRTVLILVSVCLALWQSAALIEIISQARGSGRSPLSSARGTGLPSVDGRTAQMLGSSAAVQAALKQLPVGTPAAAAGVVVFTPNGTRMTPAELEALKKHAERNRPKPPAETPPTKHR